MHCPVVLNSCAVVALVDTGANVTCVLSSLLPELGAKLVVKEGKLEDYKGRLDDRIGVVRLRVGAAARRREDPRPAASLL